MNLHTLFLVIGAVLLTIAIAAAVLAALLMRALGAMVSAFDELEGAA